MSKASKRDEQLWRARTNRYYADITQHQNTICNQIGQLRDRVQFRPIGMLQMPALVDRWADEYEAAGGAATRNHYEEDYLTNDRQRRAYAITLDTVDIGFISTFLPTDATDYRTLELIWIDPAHRSAGIATYAYTFARQHLECVAISLELGRIRSKAAYWAALGFTHFRVIEGQRGTNHALGYVQLERFGGQFLHPRVVDAAKTRMASVVRHYQNLANALQGLGC
jgi:GNAT superfamily N-acetyltransferase